MAHVIAITSGKGGAGKSSVTVGLATAFAAIGRKVLILELDLGLRCIDIMLGLEHQIVYDLGDVVNGSCRVRDAIVASDRRGRLDYIPAPMTISASFDFERVAMCIRSLKREYDYILVDTPAGLGLSILSVKNLADLAVIVATPDPVCIRDGEKVAVMIEQMGFSNYKLIINRVSKRSMKKSTIHDLDDVIDGVGAQLIGVVPENAEFQWALGRGSWVESKNIVNQVFSAIVQRIEGTYIPLMIETL